MYVKLFVRVVWQVGKELMIPGGAKVIDASGKLVLPGGIDTSVHLQQTFMNASIQEDFYSGTKVRSSAHTCVWLVSLPVIKHSPETAVILGHIFPLTLSVLS